MSFKRFLSDKDKNTVFEETPNIMEEYSTSGGVAIYSTDKSKIVPDCKKDENQGAFSKEQYVSKHDTKKEGNSGGRFAYKGEPIFDSKKITEKKEFQIPIRKEKKNVIIFVLENTFKVNERKAEILRIINKITEDNNSEFLLFLRIGSDQKFFNILDFDSFNRQNVLNNLLTRDSSNNDKVDLGAALKHINGLLDSYTPFWGDIEYKGKKYEIQSTSIIFIGTAEYDNTSSTKRDIQKLVNYIIARSNVKTIKYFCMEDNETIKAAMLGFPVIGHIVADFYK